MYFSYIVFAVVRLVDMSNVAELLSTISRAPINGWAGPSYVQELCLLFSSSVQTIVRSTFVCVVKQILVFFLEHRTTLFYPVMEIV